MPLTPAAAKAAARAAIDAAYGPIPADLLPAEKAGIEAGRDKLAESVASMSAYIQANAAVVVASVSGVTPGPAASGPGTGTLT
jgi:hypothetical protein